ncbi:ABC transporter permease [Kineosporia rhizophila]|uniref:ABC transporter permease n=1 Tax=Kineosporia TaxID=49184 RepID=UPI001E508636|nr:MULTISPECIES: ABC transporter permease [Kineosporia]MCE0534680.1 ABC transporter permease [Kineosporia rhizophila]GLY19396.1 transport permease protein [Kineosporia sp. NBRC 101677]
MSDLTLTTGPGTAATALSLTGRTLRLSRRNTEALVMSLVLPLMLMLVFVYLFGGAVQTGTEYVTYVVPGVLLLCASFGASLTAGAVSHDMSSGIIDRFRSMDVGGGWFLCSHVVASLVRNLVSTTVVLGVAVAIGFRPHTTPLRALAAAGVLFAFVLALSWLSAVAGLIARTPEAASGFTFVPMFLPYASSAFVPIDTMPSWLRAFAENQPVTPVVESVRGFLLGTEVGSAPGLALAWSGGLLLIGVALSGVLFRRRTA